MKLSVARLLTDMLTLELPRRGQAVANRFEVAHAVNVRGTYEHGDNAIRLDRIAADVLDLNAARWDFAPRPGTGSLPLTTTSTTLSGFTLDLRIPHGDESAIGSAAAREVASTALSVIFEPGYELTLEQLRASEVVLRFIRDGLVVEVGSLTTGPGSLRLGARTLVWGALRASKVVLRDDAESGLRVTLGELALDDLATEWLRAEPTASAPAQPAKPARPPIDWAFLDGVAGQVDIDLAVLARLPIIKQHETTIAFRIPIVDGSLDFHAVERTLGFVADSVIDFEVEDHYLILEKDVPLVPRDDKVLVQWPLDSAAHALAKAEKRVRLRTLVHAERPPQSPPTAPASGKPSAFAILKLDADPIAAELTLAGHAATPLAGGTLTFGVGERPAIRRISLTGAVHHRPQASTDATTLHLGLHELALAGRGLQLGRFVVSGTLGGSVHDVLVHMAGLRPLSASILAERLTLDDASLELRPS